MNISGLIADIVNSVNIFSAAAMCLYPMVNQNRYSWKKIITFSAVYLLVLQTIVTILDHIFNLSYNATLPFVLIPSFLVYHHAFKASLPKKLYVFSLVCAFMGFISNIANGFDAIMYPNSGIENFSNEAGYIQAALCIVSTAITFVPATRSLSHLIDVYNVDGSWLISSLVSCFFLGFNLLIVPRKYESLHVNNVFLAYWGILLGLLVLLLLLCSLLYVIINNALKNTEEKQRLSLLEMQETIYEKQQQYMDDTRRLRHDFRHTIGALTALANENDLEGIKSYLNSYSKSLPEKEISHFTENIAVNALLNFYKDQAKNEGISLTWEIDFPKSVGSIPDTDICSITGNILDNAIIACKKVKKDERFIDLSMRCENNTMLYIVAANSFNGKTRERNGEYLSTNRYGSGIGLESVRVTSEKYHGAASFTHEGNEFYSEIMLQI